MNAPSRMMPPPHRRKPSVAQWMLLGAFAGGFICVIIISSAVRWSFGIWFVLIAILTVVHRRWLNRVREKRREESICSFARTLPAKTHDTWVVRAVYEEMSRVVSAPLRPEDDIRKFWKVDPEDLDALAIARRAGRSMEEVEKNPLFDRVVTVADMVAFFEHQPKLQPAVGADATSSRSTR